MSKMPTGLWNGTFGWFSGKYYSKPRMRSWKGRRYKWGQGSNRRAQMHSAGYKVSPSRGAAKRVSYYHGHSKHKAVNRNMHASSRRRLGSWESGSFTARMKLRNWRWQRNVKHKWAVRRHRRRGGGSWI